MDITQIRQDFPVLAQYANNMPVIYFDNACMALKPRQVLAAMNTYYESYPACSGRSSHLWARQLSEQIESVRQKVADFINADKSSEIVFTRNTTEGINLVAKSLDLQEGDQVLISGKEHNSNLIPWQILAEIKKLTLVIAPLKEDNSLDMEKFKELVEEVKFVSMVYTSNLDGMTFPMDEIIELSHQAGAKVLVDAAQAIPHTQINVKKLGADFLAFSGHKIMGPTGTGVLYGKYDQLTKLQPFMTGGSTVANSSYQDYELLPPPQRFEAGLQDYAGIIGLGAAIDYLLAIGYESIESHLYALNKIISDGVMGLSQIKIIGDYSPSKRAGIISFVINGMDDHQIALILNENANIMVRSGQHCVHSWFGNQAIKGTVRASLYIYNTQEEVLVFLEQIKNIISIL